MSYAIDLSFKEMRKDEIFDFIQKFKELVIKPEEVKKRIKENYYFSVRWVVGSNSNDLDDFDVEDRIESWIDRLFTFKFIWIERYSLLACVIRKDDLANSLFDGNVFFQNSTDQDYDYGVWKDIRPFKEISDSVKKLTMDEEGISRLRELSKNFKNIDWFGKPLSDFTENEFEYYKRSLVYKMIFDPIEDLVFDSKNTIWVSMISDPLDEIMYCNFYKSLYRNKTV